jgi:hypothetical protein
MTSSGAFLNFFKNPCLGKEQRLLPEPVVPLNASIERSLPQRAYGDLKKFP